MSSNFAQDDGFFQGAYGEQQTGYSMPYEQSANDFGTFDYSQSGAGAQEAQTGYSQQQYDPNQGFASSHTPYSGNILTPDQSSFTQPVQTDEDDYENEPPLLEELG